MMRPTRTLFNRLDLGAVALVVLVLGGGCLGEPEIDERWTLLEMVAARPGAGTALSAGDQVEFEVRGRITYRDIETGFLVAEARYADALDRRTLRLDPDVHDLAGALDVERVLENSVTAGRATRAVTGFDHLVQTVDLQFTAQVPAALAAAPSDSADYRGLYLVLYLGEGDEIELQNGRDSLVVTPFRVEDTEVLFTGFALDANAGGTP